MKVVQDNLWLCTDCTIAAVNDDYSGLDYSYKGETREQAEQDIRHGLAFLGANLVSDSDSETGEGIKEFSSTTCDCCGTRLAGYRSRFAILG